MIMYWSMVNSFFFRYENCSVYEIYPESETPHLTKIAHLDFEHTKYSPAHLLPEMVIWYGSYEDKVVFRIWDYRLNHSITFSVADFFSFRPEVYFIFSKRLKLVLTHSLKGNRDENRCHRLI